MSLVEPYGSIVIEAKIILLQSQWLIFKGEERRKLSYVKNKAKFVSQG